MYDTILFDLDGTLTDPKEGITKCVQYALSKMGIDQPDLDKLLCFIGPPLAEAFSEYAGLSREEALQALEFYRERFAPVGIYENAIIPGVPQLLDSLKKQGKTIALATAKPLVYARRVLEHFNIIEYFDVLVGAELDGRLTRKEDVIKEVLSRIPQCSSPVMVGDRHHDVEGAHACSLPCIGVRFGYAEKDELENAGADFIADDIQMLSKLLLD